MQSIFGEWKWECEISTIRDSEMDIQHSDDYVYTRFTCESRKRHRPLSAGFTKGWAGFVTTDLTYLLTFKLQLWN